MWNSVRVRELGSYPGSGGCSGGFDTDLVLFWVLQEGSPLCQSPPQQRHRRKGESKHSSVSSHCSCRITDTDILAKPSWALMALKSRMWQRILFFFLPGRGSDQECLLQRQTQIEGSQFKQLGKGGGGGMEWSCFPPFLPTELCLKFVVLLRKVAVKLDSFPWTLSYLKCDDIKEPCLILLSAGLSREQRRWAAGFFKGALFYSSCAYMTVAGRPRGHADETPVPSKVAQRSRWDCSCLFFISSHQLPTHRCCQLCSPEPSAKPLQWRATVFYFTLFDSRVFFFVFCALGWNMGNLSWH